MQADAADARRRWLRDRRLLLPRKQRNL